MKLISQKLIREPQFSNAKKKKKQNRMFNSKTGLHMLNCQKELWSGIFPIGKFPFSEFKQNLLHRSFFCRFSLFFLLSVINNTFIQSGGGGGGRRRVGSCKFFTMQQNSETLINDSHTIRQVDSHLKQYSSMPEKSRLVLKVSKKENCFGPP